MASSLFLLLGFSSDGSTGPVASLVAASEINYAAFINCWLEWQDVVLVLPSIIIFS